MAACDERLEESTPGTAETARRWTARTDEERPRRDGSPVSTAGRAARGLRDQRAGATV